VPFGAGTTTSMSLVLPKNENRIIISVDMLYMNKIKWVDRINMTACIEAGTVGKHLEEELEK
jgi:alkyldihydroxyacetonephosphate synthase